MGLTFSKAFVEHTKKDGKLNNNSVIRYQAMLSSIFKKGVQWGLINENPCSRAEHPKVEEIDIRVLTEEEIPTLLGCSLGCTAAVQCDHSAGLAAWCSAG